MNEYLPFVAPAWLLVVGFYGMATSRNLIHLIMCLAVTQASTYLLLLMVGYRLGATAPVFSDVLPGTRATDPVVQALTLTDVVVGATVTALLLALALRVHKKAGTIDPDEIQTMKG